MDIVKARALRQMILFNKRDVARENVWRDGVEHPCWWVQGYGWHALVLTRWDAVKAASQAEPNPKFRDELLQREMLELFIDGDDQPVLAMNYALEAVALDEFRPASMDEAVTVFRRGHWERLFDRDRGPPSVRCHAAPDGPSEINPFDLAPVARKPRRLGHPA